MHANVFRSSPVQPGDKQIKPVPTTRGTRLLICSFFFTVASSLLLKPASLRPYRCSLAKNLKLRRSTFCGVPAEGARKAFATRDERAESNLCASRTPAAALHHRAAFPSLQPHRSRASALACGGDRWKPKIESYCADICEDIVVSSNMHNTKVQAGRQNVE